MSYIDFITPAIDHAKDGASFDEQKKYDDAYKSYMKSIEFFMTAIKHEKKNVEKKNMLKKKVTEIMDRAQTIKEHLNNKEKHENETEGKPENGVTKNKKEDDSKEKEKMEFENALSNAIVSEKPNVKWSDVAGLENAKESITEAVILPLKYPQLFLNITPWQGILLYGPPGTGKSYIAKAVATESDSTFFSISSADLISKWQGESEKLVRTLFQMARKAKPSIVFIDEIDSLCGSRSEGENDSTRRVKTEFLVQMDGVGKESQGILILGATNLPYSLDSAIRRRFQKRIYIPLPDKQARIEIFKIHIGKVVNDLDKKNFEALGDKTEGYSGSDIFNVVRNALMEPIRTCTLSQHFKKVKGKHPKNW